MSTQTVLRKGEQRGYSIRGYKPAEKGLYSDLAELRRRSAAALNYDVGGDELMETVKSEMKEFQESIVSAVEDMQNSPLEKIIHRVFFKTVEYFNSLEKLVLTRQIFLASVSPAANKTTLAVSRVVKDTNCAIFSQIYDASIKTDFDAVKCQFIIARYMTMLQNFLAWMFPRIGEREFIQKTAEAVWSTFEQSITEF